MDQVSNPVDGYRRHLVVVYTDISDWSGVSERFELEERVALLGDLRDAFTPIVARHGGEIVHKEGDGFAILFGHASSHEDTGRRAAEAALDIHEAVESLNERLDRPDAPIRMHTGINSGLVLVLPGDIVSGRFEMLGEATHLANRLCKLAAPGEILVSEATLGADRLLFKTGPRRVVTLRGFPVALSVRAVLGRERSGSRFDARARRGSAPFAGRRAELGRLETLLNACRGGRGAIVAIAGPAGIGKSRLAGEFLARLAAQGLPVHRGYCEAYLGARPLQPFAQLLHSILAAEPGLAIDDAGAVAAHLHAVCGDLADALINLLAGHAGKAELPSADAVALALLRLVDRAGAHGPLTLYIDDWQWADDASRQTFGLLATRMPRPALLVLASREIDPLLAEMEIDVLAVPPLSAEEAGTAIESLLVAPDPFLVERIVQGAGGSPLFVEELCHAQLGGRDTHRRGDRNAWLDMLIQARFSQLPPDLAELIRTAAVIGHMIPEWLFEAITGLGTADRAMQRLAEEDFVYSGEIAGTLRFKHGITRDAIYRTVGMHARKALHRRVVQALHARASATGEDEQLEMLAYHYGACGDWARAYAYALRAGDKAMEAGALDIAQAQYRAASEAVAALGDTPERAQQANDAVRKFGLSCVVDPSPDQLETLAGMAALAQSTDNSEGLALSLYWLGAINYGLGEPRRSIAHLEQALQSALPLGHPRLTAQIRANLGQSYFAASDCAVAADVLDEAIAGLRIKKSERLSTGLAYTLCCRGFLLADQGNFDAAQVYYDEVEQMLSGAEPPMRGAYYTQVAAVGLWKGDYDVAIDYGDRGVRLSERTRTRYICMMSRALAAYGRWCATRDPVAVDDLVRATGWFLSGASQQRSSLCFGWLADIMVDTGRRDRARFYAAQALLRARKGDRLGEAMACRAMARLAAQGEPGPGADHYLAMAHRSGEARLSPREHALTRQCAAEIARARGAGDATGFTPVSSH